ncbi:MAG: hypothetical protein KF718_06190 [Polyangiaceae bacterium]|nr:hypothetical protein [Polyangiaceae bacterium]
MIPRLLSLLLLCAASLLAAGARADGGVDAGTAPLGTPCSDATQCASGFCAEGVCCDAACTAECETCIGNQVGTCEKVPAGSVSSHKPCVSEFWGCHGACDGTSPSCVYPSAAAGCDGLVSCSEGKLVTQACVQGACGTATTDCGYYRCIGSSCLTTCSGQADCVTGTLCEGGQCVLRTKPTCWNDDVSLAPDGIGTNCAPYRCDAESGACATSCTADDECRYGAECMTGRCVDFGTVRRVGLYDPETCTCEAPGGRGRSGAMVVPLLALVLFGLRRRSRSGRATSVSLALVLAALLACGSPWEELPPDEVCKDVGLSIASRTEACSKDPELASARWDAYESRYRCAVKKVDDSIRLHYVCPVEVMRMDCDMLLGFGDDLDAMLASIPECLAVVMHADGTPLVEPADGGVDAAVGDAEAEAQP